MFLQLSAASGPHKGTQTETTALGSLCNANGTSTAEADGVLPPCSCDARTVFDDMKGQLQQEHDADKDSALKSLEERVKICCLVLLLLCFLPPCFVVLCYGAMPSWMTLATI